MAEMVGNFNLDLDESKLNISKTEPPVTIKNKGKVVEVPQTPSFDQPSQLNVEGVHKLNPVSLTGRIEKISGFGFSIHTRLLTVRNNYLAYYSDIPKDYADSWQPNEEIKEKTPKCVLPLYAIFEISLLTEEEKKKKKFIKDIKPKKLTNLDEDEEGEKQVDIFDP